MPTEAVGSRGVGFAEGSAILPTSMKHVRTTRREVKERENYRIPMWLPSISKGFPLHFAPRILLMYF